MNDINLNIFSNKNEILKSEFEELVKQNDLEVYTEKALLEYLKTIKSGLKNNEELQTTTEFQHIHPITVVTEKGLKGRVFYRSIYDLEKSECIGTNFEKGGLPEGTIKDWKGGKFIKQSGKWVPVKKEKQENIDILPVGTEINLKDTDMDGIPEGSYKVIKNVSKKKSDNETYVLEASDGSTVEVEYDYIHKTGYWKGSNYKVEKKEGNNKKDNGTSEVFKPSTPKKLISPLKNAKTEKEDLPITTQQFKSYFNSNYPYIQHNLSNKKIEKFINKYKNQPIEKIADLFSDYLLSQGLADVQP